MGSKIPPFGEWKEGKGGKNITVRFDNAQRKKTNGQMINPNDPQNNPDRFPHKAGPSAQPSRAADPKGKCGGIPQFGDWKNGDALGVGYTTVFENVQKTKNVQPTPLANEPHMNEDLQALAQAQAQAQARPQSKPAILEPQQESRSKEPTFGGWKNGDNVDYSAVFENVRKTNSGQHPTLANEPQMNRDMQPTAQPQARPQSKPAKLEPQQEPRSKVPIFGSRDASEGDYGYTECFDNVGDNTENGHTVTPEYSNVPPVEEGRPKVLPFDAWEEGDNGGAHFENARKKKNMLEPIEPQLIGDVNNKAQPPTAVGAKNKVGDHLRNASKESNASMGSSSESVTKYGKQNPGGQPPINQKGGRLRQKPPDGRGSQTPGKGAAIPPWGDWHSDPSQAKDYTGYFRRAKEEKNTPIHSNVPPRYHEPPKPQEPKRGCCFGWF